MAGKAEPLKAIAQMPIKEVTIFKDGHAFVLHRGKMPVTPSGKVVMDYLPAPVLGTYWPFSADKNAELRSVTAGKRKILVKKTALTLREMIEANIGARVVVTERPPSPASREAPPFYQATILEVPARSGEELEALTPSAAEDQLPAKGSVVMVKTDKGIKALDFDRILDVTFLDERKHMVADEEFRNMLTLDLKWKGAPQPEAEVGMLYLQRGLRWIPGYKIDIDGQGKAMLKLEATLVNELTDLHDATAHLVIGVPSFAFQHEVDPISLQQSVANLSSRFRRDAGTAFAFSNAIMSQVSMPAPANNNRPAENTRTMDLGPEIAGGRKSEDLYMFTVEHLSLRKGERMVMPIAEYELPYSDIYALDVPFTPPPEVMQNIGNSQRAGLARAFAAPKVKHKIRISNKSKQPLTTAPAMILKDGRILAQGMMTYTPAGGEVDIELTTSVDIAVEKSDKETKRTPNAINWNGHNYARIDLEGKITLTNYKKESVEVEITRYVLGNVDTVGQNGENEMLNPFEDNSFLPDGAVSNWWRSYYWPWWWYRFNGIGKITWTTKLEPGKPADHTYDWHYFWD
jgi:hypothetical protein